MIGIVLALVAATAIAVLAVALRTRRRSAVAARTRASDEAANWTGAAGDEFTGLAEPARCDLVFAVAALDDARARPLLERALRDPSETVALAAAHALGARGDAALAQRYLDGHPGERASRIAHALALLSPSF